MTARTTCDVWQRLNGATQRFSQAIQPSDSRLGFMPAIRDSNAKLRLNANGYK
ncbi:MAG: hypothetical protein GY924_07345 [Planctomycetaceae bacterium]|nr:hypothetical protein [Planctomycetaceae bacterium]